MENENYITATSWLRNKETVITHRSFESGPRFYVIDCGGRCANIATDQIKVLEGIRDAATALISEYRKHEADAAELENERITERQERVTEDLLA